MWNSNGFGSRAAQFQLSQGSRLAQLADAPYLAYLANLRAYRARGPLANISTFF